MKQFVTTGIILSRTDFGEADRILTMLTPDHGKVRVVAKGVRRVKSKLAGGIELFSISNISYAPGRGELGTLVSTRLIRYYRHIVENIDRTMFGYELIKQLNKVTEDAAEAEYFELLDQAFAALDDITIDLQIVSFWFACQLLRLNGYTPNLQTDSSGKKLDQAASYEFDYDNATFNASSQGQFASDHIKFLRISFGGHSARTLSKIQSSAQLAQTCQPIITTMLANSLRI